MNQSPSGSDADLHAVTTDKPSNKKAYEIGLTISPFIPRLEILHQERQQLHALT